METILIAIAAALINVAIQPSAQPTVVKKYRLEAPTGLKARVVSAPQAVTDWQSGEE